MGVLLLISLILQIDVPSAKYYTFLGGERELQMKVSIWGEIGSPGMYSIPEGSDVVLLVTIAGGPTKDAAVSKIRVVRSFPEPVVIYINLNDFFKTGRRDKIPELCPGDMIYVERTRFRAFKETIGILGEMSYMFGFLYMLYNTVREYKEKG